jgi:5-methylcytosine-specific restriction enzyme subunit McrC
MLQRCGDIPFVGGDAASSAWQGTDLLELFAGCYLQALVREARRGLPRAYIREDDDLTALRGRWNPIRQYSVLAARPNRLACAYDEFSLDTPLNHMLKAAARVVRFAISSPSVQALAFEAESWLETVGDLAPREALALNPLLDRTNSRLHDLLKWARLFLQGARQDTRGGKTQGFRILFDMAEVFERYAVTQIRARYQPQGWSVVAQGGLLNMVSDAQSGAQAFQTIPDIILRRGTQTWIIDTKWKRLEPPFDAKHGVAQSDLYQMAAYARRYQAQKVTLLYPHWSGLGFDEGLLKTWKLLPGSAGDCVVDVATLALP